MRSQKLRIEKYPLKTKKTLRKYESEFAAELEKLSNEEKQAVIEKSKIATQVLASQNKTA